MLVVDGSGSVGSGGEVIEAVIQTYHSLFADGVETVDVNSNPDLGWTI